MEEGIQFISMVRLRPGATKTVQEQSGQSMAVDPAIYHTVEDTLESQGASIKVMSSGERAIFNILGDDYDIVIMGQVSNYRTLAKIDAALKHRGYIASTHPMVQSDEYRQLAEETVVAVEAAR